MKIFSIPLSFTSNLSHSLKNISLRNNLLHGIPYSFQELTNLQVLDLSQNLIKKIPPAIFSLSNLISLDLSENRIEDLRIGASPDQDGRRTLGVEADIGSTAPWSNLSKLRKLDLSHNFLGGTSMDPISLPDLVILSLAGNRVPNDQDGHLESFVNNLSHLQRLALLDISNTAITNVTFDLSQLRWLTAIISHTFDGKKLRFNNGQKDFLPGKITGLRDGIERFMVFEEGESSEFALDFLRGKGLFKTSTPRQ